jgi:hypothetical protein
MITESLASSDIRSQNASCEDFVTFMKKQNAKDPAKMTDESMTNHMFVNL